MTVRVVCGALAIVLTVLALLFAGAGGVVGSATIGQFVVPNVSTTAGRATGGSVLAPPLGATVQTSAELLPGVPHGGYASWFPDGECTNWAARNHPVSWNGNANQWLAGAQSAGVPTSSTPSVGAIVIYAAGSPYDLNYGHVAIVTSVGLGTYTVSEMNFLWHGIVDARTIAWPDGHVEGFVP